MDLAESIGNMHPRLKLHRCAEQQKLLCLCMFAGYYGDEDEQYYEYYGYYADDFDGYVDYYAGVFSFSLHCHFADQATLI